MTQPVQVALQGGAVRLTIPARIANDLGSLQTALGQLAERLGHPACATGCNTLFIQVERTFRMNEALELNAEPLAAGDARLDDLFVPQDPIPCNVLVSDRVSGDIEALQKATAVAVAKGGCDACCSGMTLAFRRELDLIAVDDRLEAQGFGRFR